MNEALVFGRGELYRKKEKEINIHYNIIGFLDNAVKESIEYMDSLPVYPPNNLLNLPPYNIVIVSVHFLSMWMQLKDLGIPDNRIAFGLFFEPLSTEMEKDLYVEDALMSSKNNSIVYSCKSLDIKEEFYDYDGFKKLLRNIYRKKHTEITAIQNFSVNPVSRIQALERGTPIDRFYIEQFLKENEECICGICMEVADDHYTKKYGGDRVCKSIVTHVKGWGDHSIKANFETGEGIEEDMADCIICTQVMQYIFDLKAAFLNIYRSLKPNGVALITLPGIKSLSLFDNDNWGERWSFTEKSAVELCERTVTNGKFEVNSYGNVKVSIAYLYGLCVEDICIEDFSYSDPQFPFLITLKILKC